MKKGLKVLVMSLVMVGVLASSTIFVEAKNSKFKSSRPIMMMSSDPNEGLDPPTI